MTRENAWKPVSEIETRLDSSVLERILDEIYGTKYQFLDDQSLERVEDANTFDDYYNLDGQYWTPTTSLGYNPTILPVNLAGWFVDKRTSWMFEKAPDLECPAKVVDPVEDMEKLDYEPSDKQKKLDSQSSGREQILYDIWGENKLPERLMEAGTDFLVGGTTALKIRYIPNLGIRLNFSPTQEVFPIPNAKDPTVLDAVHFVSYLNNESTLWKQTWEMFEGRCYLTEGTYSATNMKRIAMIYSREDTGLTFLPVILFPHKARSGKLFGRSYLKDLIPIFDQYNRSMSDAADGLRFNIFAITVLLNAPPDAEKMLKVSPNELWNIGGEGVDAKKLESGFNYADALDDFLKRLEHQAHMIGNVPKISPDDIKGFGQITGIGLKMLNLDLVSATQRSWVVWKSRLETMNEYILKMLDTYKNTEGFPYSGMKLANIANTYNNQIIPHLPLPENELEEINIEVTKLSNSLQSVKGAMQKIGVKFPERLIAEIITERGDFLEEGGGYGKQLGEEEKKSMGGL